MILRDDGEKGAAEKMTLASRLTVAESPRLKTRDQPADLCLG
jgi:hypothetical protein